MSNIKQYGRVFALCCLLITLGCSGNKNGNGGGNGDKNGGGAPNTPPAVPQSFEAMASDGQVTLSWNTEPNVTYELYYSTETGFALENGMKISPVTSPYVHMGLTNETTYYYRLTANNAAGASEPTAEVSATPGAPPAAPRNFTATAFERQVTLEWDSQEGLTYDLFHSTAAGIDVNDMNVIQISGVTSPYNHTSLTNDVTYYYLLRAVNSFGESVPTAEISAAPVPSAPPETPRNFEAIMAADGQITLSWTPEVGVTYELFHSRTPGIDVDDTNVMKISGIRTSPYNHTGLTNDVTYYYLLRAVNSLGNSVPTAEVSATPAPSAPPAAPRNFTAFPSSGQITLSWTVQEALTYELFFSTTRGFALTSENKIPSPVTSPFEHTGLTNGITYYYRLRAVNSFGASVPTAETWTRTPAPGAPAIPQDFIAAASSGQLRLTWRSQSDVTYDLFHSASEGFILENGTKISSVTPPYIHRNLMDNTRYYYRLRAENRSGMSSTTAEISAITPTPLSAEKISAGKDHTCAVVNGGAWCWGKGQYGRLGNGGNSDASAPEQVYGLTTGVTQISAGSLHTCAVVNGRALCWGNSWDGRIGDGGASSFPNTPQQVHGLTTGVTQISAGGGYTCAVVNGGAWCWGNGAQFQLGNAVNLSRNTPQQVRGFASGVEQISAGDGHTCAVVSGRAVCWGRGRSGQLGSGTSPLNASTPQQVHGLVSGVKQISAGNFHACAVVNRGAWCWGKGESFQLGNAVRSNRNTPHQVYGPPNVVEQISAGVLHTCALVDGRALCWGAGGSGRLGHNDTNANADKPRPTQVMGLTAGVTQISAGDEHTCALVDGIAKCWGSGGSGQLGTNIKENKQAPISVVDPATIPPKAPRNFWAAASEEQVTLTWAQQRGATYDLFFSTRAGFGLESGTRISSVTSPYDHTGLTNGSTYYYRLRAVTPFGASPPTIQVSATPQAKTGLKISAGGSHSCTVVDDTARCWGRGASGQLGNDAKDDQQVSVQVSGLTSEVTQISAGDFHTCAVVEGRAVCWGAGGSGQLGNDAELTEDTPVQVVDVMDTPISGVTQISAGGEHACAVVEEHAVCWGAGGSGQLGNDVTRDRKTSVQVTGLTTGVTQVSAGGSHTCAVMDGRAFCWGAGGSGRLGNDAESNQDTPVQVVDVMGTPITGVTQISAGGEHTCAVVEGRALCWGAGSNGKLGHNRANPNEDRATPTQVMGLTAGVTQISAGDEHTCAVVEGRAVCWGEGDDGRLGRSGNSDQNTPVQVAGLTAGVTQISAGDKHTCALVDGLARCWGSDDNGRLGNGALGNNWMPGTVSGL